MAIYGIVATEGPDREVMALARRLPQLQQDPLARLVYVQPAPGAREIDGHPVLSVQAFLDQPGRRLFNPAVADGAARESLAAQLIAAGAEPFTITAAQHTRFDFNEIGEGALFGPFTLVTTNVKIGRYFHAGAYSYVAHDCVIGDFVTFASRVHCNGNVRVERGARIGSGAMIRQGTPAQPMVVGENAIIEAGAVVLKHVAAGARVAGNPAREIQRP